MSYMRRFGQPMVHAIAVAVLATACGVRGPGVGGGGGKDAIARHRAELLAAGQWLGRADSTTFVVEFADYECPACRAASAAVDSMETSDREVSILFVNLPLSSHATAYPAALTSLCADDQGRGPQMHKLLMMEWSWQSDQDWDGLARRAGVADLERFHACRRASKTIARLEGGADVGRSLGVNATPTFIGIAGVHAGIPTNDILTRLATAE